MFLSNIGYKHPIISPKPWCHHVITRVVSSSDLRLCSKLFRGPEFVKMHLDAKHREEAKRIIEDKYFDCASVEEKKQPSPLQKWLKVVWCC